MKRRVFTLIAATSFVLPVYAQTSFPVSTTHDGAIHEQRERSA